MRPRFICYAVSVALLFVLPAVTKKPLRACSAAEREQQIAELFEYGQEAPGWLAVPLALHCSVGPVSWGDFRRSGPVVLKLIWKPLGFALFAGVLAVAFLAELLYGIWLLILSRKHWRGEQQSV